MLVVMEGTYVRNDNEMLSGGARDLVLQLWMELELALAMASILNANYGNETGYQILHSYS